MNSPNDTIEPKIPSQHEFDSQQNGVIEGLASAMHWVVIPLFMLALLYGVSSLFLVVQVFMTPSIDSITSLVCVGLAALLFGLLASWTKKSATSFQNVASTSGNDIGHLMEALEYLRKHYSLLGSFVKIAVAIVSIGLVAALVVFIIGRLSA